MWQRFTERARRIILLAQEEAGKMNSSNVGTEHLLLGMLRENEGVAAQVLQKMGVSLQKVRQEIEAEVQPGGEGGSSSEPKLTPKSKRVLELAADEARRMRHNYIGTEHLLIALLRGKDGAALVLKKLGLNLETARQQVSEYLGAEPPSTVEGSTGRIVARSENEFDVTPAAQIILETAKMEAQRLGHEKLDTAHLIWALLQSQGWPELLGESGLDVAKARERVEEYLKTTKF